MKKICLAVLLTFMLTSVLITTTQAQTPQETLNQYIADLQKNPNDNALREKIIKFVQEMKPAPKVPEEVATHEGAAEYAFKNAKTDADYADSAKEYEKALLVAPWLATDYFNCGVAYEKARKFDAAIRNFNFYLIAAPYGQDANDVRKRIGGLKYAIEKATQEQQAAEARARSEQERREAPQALQRRLKAEYGRATYKLLNCSHAPQSVCFQESGSFPCGCNEAEYGGSYWYQNNKDYVYISFPSDGNIVFICSFFNTPWLRGTPKGANIEDIFWEASPSGQNPQWKPVWVKLINGLDNIIYSLERPIDDSQYSPYMRYDYRQFLKK